MKILWFTSTPSNASLEFGNTYFGAGWISALETIVAGANKHQLGICFIYNGTEYKKIIKNNVVYYGIPIRKKNGIKRIMERQLGRLEDEFTSALYDEVIADFKPEVIHVFGTENGYGKILQHKFDKVVFHLQGLVAPIAEMYFPSNISKLQTVIHDKLTNILRGLTFFHFYTIFNSGVKRELAVLKHWKYFSGRTDYDRNYVKLFHPAAHYFHCDELLRPEFFTATWSPEYLVKNGKQKICIGTTINPNIYKGLDLIYRVLPLLTDYDITWNIFGVVEDNVLNNLVKKVLKINQPNPSIEFHGQLTAVDLVAKLKTCHFFVHTSYIDNSPNSVCEAMLIGMPVLSSSVGGVKSLITNKENGFLFNPQDKYDLAGLIAHLINNFDEALRCASKARADALARHNPNTILEAVNNMYMAIQQQ